MAFGAIAGMALGDASSALSTGMAAKGAMQFATGKAEEHANRKTVEENEEVVYSSLDEFARRFQEENGTTSRKEIAQHMLAIRSKGDVEGLEDYQFDLQQILNKNDEGVDIMGEGLKSNEIIRNWAEEENDTEQNQG